MTHLATLQALAQKNPDPEAALDYLKRVEECIDDAVKVILPLFSSLMRIEGWEHAIVGGEFAIIELCVRHTEVVNALNVQFPHDKDGVVDASAIYMSGLLQELYDKCWDQRIV